MLHGDFSYFGCFSLLLPRVLPISKWCESNPFSRHNIEIKTILLGYSLCASSPEIPLKLWNETKIVETNMDSRCHHPIKRAYSKLFKTINGTERWNSPPWRKVVGISKEKNKWRWYQMYCDEKVRQAAVATDIFGPLKQHFATTLIVSPVSQNARCYIASVHCSPEARLYSGRQPRKTRENWLAPIARSLYHVYGGHLTAVPFKSPWNANELRAGYRLKHVFGVSFWAVWRNLPATCF